MRIALTGNPNSGKTTLYNALTGGNEKVGNWAGVTVAKKEGSLKKSYISGSDEVSIVDLPGAYSMSPFTSEESITSAYVKNENPDAIINIVDATNLSRSLFFTSQLLELGIPVVVALNKTDLNKKKDIVIDVNNLSEELGCPVVETVSTDASNKGIAQAVKVALSAQYEGAPYSQGEVDVHNKEAVIAADKKRFEYISGLVSKVETRKVATNEKTTGDKIDAVLGHKWGGIVIFALVMYLVFSISQAWVGPVAADWLVGWIETFQEWVGGQLEGASPILSAILVDGIIGGVGAVVGFLPLVMVMYFLIALLEDCGYMARVAMILDRFFKKIGLSGKSIIPIIIGTGCAIPGVMAARTIRNERERRTTAMLTPFIPCGAKLPVIALFGGAFFSGEAWVSYLMYVVGIVLIVLCSLLVMKITGAASRKSFFIIELPEYKAPSLYRALMQMLSRAWSFIVKAATIILICNMAVQVMQMFDWSFQVVEEGMEDTSILASLASPFAFLLVPLGFGTWQLAAAAITGFIAKENVVGTLAVVYGITNFIDTDALEMAAGAGGDVASVMGLTSVAALAYLMFNLYTPPCFAAIGAMNSEMGSKKWLFGGIGLQFGIAYSLAFCVYQFGTLFTTGAFGEGFVVGLIVVLVFAGILVYLVRRGKAKLEEYALTPSKPIVSNAKATANN